MTDETTPPLAPGHAPKAIGFVFGFLTLGVGVLNSVGPAELLIRATVMAVVATVCAKLVSALWHYLADDEMESENYI